MQFTGTTTHVEIEGGFWGILGDDGVPYHPVNGLPSQFQKESIRVKVKANPSSKISVFMWGRLVEIETIELLDK